jgi:hypothetical protein
MEVGDLLMSKKGYFLTPREALAATLSGASKTKPIFKIQSPEI